ncbi:MAG: TAXI family TRAP transporter solute-binding subunit [Hyphomicrobiales bacterium]|nr:TAXI family TRAP transporter solute-binding subunit [Hyphomicrobiales bacterium]
MKRLLLAAAAAAVLATPATAEDRTGWPTNFTVGTASQGGTYFTYGSGWANLVAEELGVTGGGEVTSGPFANMANVHTGENLFGMTTMGPARESLEGNSPLAPGVKFDKACAMFPMYETPFSITTLTSSGISSIAEIPDGARIGFGPAGSTSDTYFPRMLETLGVDFDKRNGSWSDLAGQLQDGLLDVIAFAAGIPVPAISQLEVQADINVVQFSDEEKTKVLEAFPVSSFTIPAGTYTSLDGDAAAVSMWNFAIVNCDLPESFVYAATKAVLDNHDRMMEIHKAARATLPENWEKNTFMPFHPGAVRYYEEKGFDIPDNLTYGG